jgi:hypothetical protein
MGEFLSFFSFFSLLFLFFLLFFLSSYFLFLSFSVRSMADYMVPAWACLMYVVRLLTVVKSGLGLWLKKPFLKICCGKCLRRGERGFEKWWR